MDGTSYVLHNVHAFVNSRAWKVEGWRKYKACVRLSVRHSYAAVEDSARDNDESKRDMIRQTKSIR